MISATLLTTWNLEKETILEADASGYVVARALLQRGNDNLLHAVAYYSRKITLAEANYPIYDKEMLAIVSCIRQWSPELASISFEVYSDHKNLGYFRKA